MNLRLDVCIYGTVIPELRTLLYRTDARDTTIETPAEVLYRLDRSLRGADLEVPTVETDLLDTLYRTCPIDRELLVLIEAVHAAGGETTACVPRYRDERSTRAAILTAYLRSVPDYVRIHPADEYTAPGTAVPEAILVARQMESVEDAITRGAQAIHYESAARLKREIEIRGYRIDHERPPIT